MGVITGAQGVQKTYKLTLFLEHHLEVVESRSSRVRLVLDKDENVCSWTIPKARPYMRQSRAKLVKQLL